jgi:hypothetical protein
MILQFLLSSNPASPVLVWVFRYSLRSVGSALRLSTGFAFLRSAV